MAICRATSHASPTVKGSTDAWRELVELYGPLVDSWSAQAGLSRAVREDIVQEVFLAVHRSIDRFDPTTPGATFRGWLWRITRNAVLQFLRKTEPLGCGGSTANALLADIADPWPDASESEPPSSAVDTSALLSRALNQIQARIEPETWLAFWKTAVQGRSASEVAAELGMTSAAVRKAKSRTLQRLRKQLGDPC
jgi:RNA polymerase sigma-70 factor, ECF subfamily